MVGWHHRLNGQEFEQTLGDGEGQGSLACCIPRGHKESDVTEGQTTTRAVSVQQISLLWSPLSMCPEPQTCQTRQSLPTPNTPY